MTTTDARDRRINAADKQIDKLQEKRQNYLKRAEEIEAELDSLIARKTWLVAMPVVDTEVSSNGTVHNGETQEAGS